MPEKPEFSWRSLALAVVIACPGGAALAEEDATAPGISIELNAAAETEGACQLSFMVENRGAADLSRAVYEAVLFDRAGAVARLTLLDFRDLPRGRPRVRQFRIDTSSCADLGRILINGAETCEGAPAAACVDGLRLDSRTDIDLIG